MIFDHESAVFTDVDGWFNQNRKLHMDGWAIKFTWNPLQRISASGWHPRLRPPLMSFSSERRLSGSKHHASELADDLRRILPLSSTTPSLTDWKGADNLLFRA